MPPQKRVCSSPIQQNIVAAAAGQAVVARAAADQIGGIAAGQGVVGIAAMDRRPKRTGIDAQMGDAAFALAGGKDLDHTVFHMQRQGADVVQGHFGAVGDLRQMQQSPPRQQGQQGVDSGSVQNSTSRSAGSS